MDLPQPQSKNAVDQAVWDSFRRGSKPAFENIYRHHVQELYHYGIKIHSNSSLIKDVIQSLFVELWNQRASLSSTDNVKYYLFKALRFKIYRELKNQTYRDQQQGSYYEQEFIESTEVKLMDAELKAERKQMLHKALAELPPRQKEILHLLYSEELSYEKIAELMAINVASVYTLAWKALSALKRLMVVWLLLLLW